MSTKQIEALKLALEALEKAVATCFDRYSHEHVMSRPEHFVNQAITAIREALAEQPAHESAYQRGYMDGIAKGLRMDQPAQQQEHVIDCPRCGHCCPQPAQQQEPVADEVRCPECGYLTKHTEHIGCLRKQLNAINAFEQRNFAIVNMDKFPPAQPSKPWVGLTKKEVHDLYDSDYAVFHQRIEAKLREKNA